MRIGAVGFQMYQPYIYNTNTVSGKSLSKVNPIGDDLLSSGTDFSGMTDEEQQNLNPLRRGETVNFADVIAMQMQMGRMNADKIMKPAAEEISKVSAAVESDSAQTSEDIGIRAVRTTDGAGKAQRTNDGAGVQQTEGKEAVRPPQTDASLYQLRRASFAYQMNMIA
ncbi:MAG: hypothetical protein NC517_11785 [Firmicutes bacterium]|nr:hypothetical protein [Bacillota bacterium]